MLPCPATKAKLVHHARGARRKHLPAAQHCSATNAKPRSQHTPVPLPPLPCAAMMSRAMVGGGVLVLAFFGTCWQLTKWYFGIKSVWEFNEVMQKVFPKAPAAAAAAAAAQ